MARPVYVARDPSQQDALQVCTIFNLVPPPRDHFHFEVPLQSLPSTTTQHTTHNTSALDGADAVQERMIIKTSGCQYYTTATSSPVSRHTYTITITITTPLSPFVRTRKLVTPYSYCLLPAAGAPKQVLRLIFFSISSRRFTRRR
eukprot:scaffold22967_cov33-Tisochrysis_lutea.AAC.3